METLLVFLAIAAIQMIAAYNKQKKEVAKKADQQYTPPQEPTGPIFDDDEPEHEPKHEPLHHAPLPAHPVIVADTPIGRGAINRAPTNHQFNLKDPAQGILWTAILQEPRYKVKWKQR
jgi:hypothetical protein